MSSNFDNPSFLISNLHDRAREMEQKGIAQTDPFFLLKEVAEMSKLNDELHMTDKQRMAREQYNAIASQNYLEGGFDKSAIEEKIKKLKFAKQDSSSKDPNWFKNMAGTPFN